MFQLNTDKEALKGAINDVLLFLFQQQQLSGFEYRLADRAIGPRLDRLTDEQAKQLREIVKIRLTFEK